MLNHRLNKPFAGFCACALCTAIFFTACQATPEKDIVIGKSGNLSDLIQATLNASDIPSDTSGSLNNSPTQTNSELYSKLEVPKHWNFEAKALNDKLNIKADTDIALPVVSQLPAATASLSEFTQEDLNKIAEVWGVSGAVWTERNPLTKEVIEQMILDSKKIIATGTDNDNVGNLNDEMIQREKESLEYYEKLYQDAQYENDLEKKEFSIDILDSSGDQSLIGFEGTTRLNNQPFFFGVSNSYSPNGVNKIYANYGMEFIPFGGVEVDTPDGVSLTSEQAALKASEIAAKLTNDLTLCYIKPATTGSRDGILRDWGWACVFMREINGCPTAYEKTELGSSLDAINASVTYEKMIIVVDDEGMVSFTWDIPMTIEAVDNPDVSSLPFTEISQLAIEQITQRFADVVRENVVDGVDWSDPGCSAIIQDVELGLTRVAKQNSPDYYYMPVWKFFVKLQHTEDYYTRTDTKPLDYYNQRGPDGYPSNIDYEYLRYTEVEVITLNAIDGSVIDSNLGY